MGSINEPNTLLIIVIMVLFVTAIWFIVLKFVFGSMKNDFMQSMDYLKHLHRSRSSNGIHIHTNKGQGIFEFYQVEQSDYKPPPATHFWIRMITYSFLLILLIMLLGYLSSFTIH
mgnify:CR=1 FL=1